MDPFWGGVFSAVLCCLLSPRMCLLLFVQSKKGDSGPCRYSPLYSHCELHGICTLWGSMTQDIFRPFYPFPAPWSPFFPPQFNPQTIQVPVLCWKMANLWSQALNEGWPSFPARSARCSCKNRESSCSARDFAPSTTLWCAGSCCRVKLTGTAAKILAPAFA